MKSKGSVLVVFLIAAVVVLTVFGFLAGSNFLGKKTAVNQATFSALPSGWKNYTSPDGKFSFQYPAEFGELDSKSTRFNFTLNGGKVAVMWFRVLDNPRRLPLDQFWAEEKYVFWDHAGETLKQSKEEKLIQAKQYFDKSEKISVGDKKITGYKIVVPDVLPRVEIFWANVDKVFNLGYSAYEEKSKYAQEILDSFKLR